MKIDTFCVPGLLPDAPQLRIEDLVKDFFENAMIPLCHAPDDVVQERRDARGHLRIAVVERWKKRMGPVVPTSF